MTALIHFFALLNVIFNLVIFQPSQPWRGMYTEPVSGIQLEIKTVANGKCSGNFTYQGMQMPIEASLQNGKIAGIYLYQDGRFPFSLEKRQEKYYLTADGVTAEVQRSSASNQITSGSTSQLSDRWTQKLRGKQLLFLETSGGGTSKVTLDLLSDGQFRYAASSSYTSGGFSDFSYAGEDKDFGIWRIQDERGLVVLVTQSKKTGETLRTPIRPGAVEGQVLLNGKRFFITSLR